MNSTPIFRLSHKMAAHPLSLLMILHKCHEYYAFCDDLADVCNLIAQIKSDEEPDETEFGYASAVAQKALALLKVLNGVSPTVLIHIEDIGKHFGEISSGLSGSYILGHLETIRNMVGKELESKKFLYIPEANDAFLEKDQLFGADVYDAFPDARVDLTSAGTAFAMELHTACVFQLMRVAEHGLRSLAKKLHVRLSDKAKFLPLDYADWNAVITGIRGKITDARKLPKGPKKQRKLELYSDAADHCDFMKDIWRNTVSHARNPYSQSEALAAMDRVKAFMQFLSVSLQARW